MFKSISYFKIQLLSGVSRGRPTQVHLSDKGKIKAIGFYLELKEMARDDACNILTEKINAHLTKLSAHKAKK